MTIGNRIRAIRNAMDPKLSQKELAKRVGKAQSLIAYLESDAPGVGSTHITSIARALNVDAHWLKTGEGRPERNQAPPVGKSYCKEIALAIKIMEATDDRGREKALIAIKDAVDAHKAFLDSLPLPRATSGEDLEDLMDRMTLELLPEINDDERASNDVCKNQDVAAQKGGRH